MFDVGNETSSRLDATGKAISQNIIGDHILVIKPLVMTIDVLDQSLLKIFNSDQHCFDKDVWFLKQPNIADLLNRYILEETSIQTSENSLYSEAKEIEDIRSIVSYRKGCGKWIDTLKGCPFSNAQGLMTADMTSSENRIVELWKKMCALYSVVV